VNPQERTSGASDGVGRNPRAREVGDENLTHLEPSLSGKMKMSFDVFNGWCATLSTLACLPVLAT
jgi:hypothetical protein